MTGIQGAMQILGETFPKGDVRRQVTDEIQKQIYRLERLDSIVLTRGQDSQWLIVRIET